jgi:putative methyltransferase (TIGR04325 family)
MTSIGIFSNPTSRNLIRESRKSEVWESERWVSRQKSFLELALLGIYERESLLLDNNLLKSVSGTVVDFGGGSGWLYHKIEKMDFDLEGYINVESIDLHTSCQHNKNDYSFMEIGSSLSNIKYSSDTRILYLNSVLQYLDDNSVLIELVRDILPTCLILEDVTLSSGDEFFAEQLYYDTTIPYRFVSEKSLISTLESVGLGLSRRIMYTRNIADGYSYDFSSGVTDFNIGETVSLEFIRLNHATLIN